MRFFFFFFNDTATTEIYTLSLHDALPIYPRDGLRQHQAQLRDRQQDRRRGRHDDRSEEHTSELQSQSNLVCRLLLEKKKKNASHRPTQTLNARKNTVVYSELTSALTYPVI